jgi:hypothetical protein
MNVSDNRALVVFRFHRLAFRYVSDHCSLSLVPNAYWEELVPSLKIRCVAAHCLQQSLLSVLDAFIFRAPELSVSELFQTLTESRTAAQEAGKDKDVSTAFQEALLHDWGDGVAEVEYALENAARLSHLHGSAMFFLTQEASATHALTHMLSSLYLNKTDENSLHDEKWDYVAFAEPHFLAMLKEVIGNFIESEGKDGHLIDPNVWRNVSESGGKVALYCTSFATVVVELLRIIRAVTPEQFSRHKHVFFPTLFSLVSAQSEEIRKLVQEILERHVAPLLNVQLKI